MSETQINPFGAPESTSLPADNMDQKAYPDATNGKRFLNHILDMFCYYTIMAAFGAVTATVSSTNGDPQAVDQFLNSIWGSLLVLSIYPGYYIFFESLLGMTPGKLITGTRVVGTFTHEKPGIGAVILRTLVRFVPFEALSFFGSRPGGWHDHWSKTRTIDKRAEPMSLEDYREMQSLLI